MIGMIDFNLDNFLDVIIKKRQIFIRTGSCSRFGTVTNVAYLFEIIADIQPNIYYN